VSNAEIILAELDRLLDSDVELTLYGRAALQLGFENPSPDFAVSKDVDAVFFLGQAEYLNEHTNFWRAVDILNRNLAEQDLYVSHFFVEDQVVLRPAWKDCRCRIPGEWSRLDLYRLGDEDLLLSKLMRDDPLDHSDALFIASRAQFTRQDVEVIIAEARIPAADEIAEQFAIASKRLLDAIGD